VPRLENAMGMGAIMDRLAEDRTGNHGILSEKKLSPIEQSADVCNRGQINKAASAILNGNRCS
jgi:hypothetical protein